MWRPKKKKVSAFICTVHASVLNPNQCLSEYKVVAILEQCRVLCVLQPQNKPTSVASRHHTLVSINVSTVCGSCKIKMVKSDVKQNKVILKTNCFASRSLLSLKQSRAEKCLTFMLIKQLTGEI